MPKIRKDNENSPSGRISAIELRAYIHIETVSGKKVPEIHAALKEACGRFTVNRSTVQRWHTKFREGRTSIEDEPRAGLPSTVTADNTNASIIATLLHEDRRITIRMLHKNGTLNGIQALPRRWQACIDTGGDYIEGL
ncbi:Protein GVQW3 [Anthophora plagiata]